MESMRGKNMSLNKNQLQWVTCLVKRALREPVQVDPGMVAKQTQLFLEELCELMESTAKAFNEFLGPAHTQIVCHTFRLGQPRPGIMILRGKEKLVVSSEIGRVRARIVQVHAYNEVCLETLDVIGRVSSQGDLEWWTADNSQAPSVLVSPDLVLRYYLGHFFADGCQYFYKRNQGQTQLNIQKGTGILESRV
jgi:hypothetical protein